MKFTNEQKATYLSKDNDSFCIFPWIHLYTEPDGRTFPCCTVEQDTINENTKDKTLAEIFNSDDWNKLRLDMLKGIKNPICRRCHAVEESSAPSYRTFANDDFGDYIDIIDETNDDGTVNKFELKYIDVRFSNQCNFACASCGPVFSTKWIKMIKQKRTERDSVWTNEYVYNRINDHSKEDYVEQLKPHLADSHQIYFAGGEPLIIDDHYRLLEYLDQEKIYNTKLRYNTNLSNLKYKKTPIVESWKNFELVELGASIDAMGELAEIIRHGTKWDVIENNIKEVLKYDNIRLNYDTTVTILNIDHLPDFYDYILENDLLKEDSWFTTNIAFTPLEFSITSLPKEVKDQITKKLSRWAERLKYRDFYCRVSRHAINDISQKMWNIIDFMNSKDTWSPIGFSYEIDSKLWHTDRWEEIPYFKYMWNTYTEQPWKDEINAKRKLHRKV